MKRNCPVCGSDQNYLFLERNEVPIFQNIVIPEQNFATQFHEGKIILSACPKCGFVYNQAFDDHKIIYNQAYDNCQLHSGYFEEYVSNLAHHLLEVHKIRNSRIIEIGCGQGEFIKRMVENPEYGNSGVGFDPSYRGQETLFEGRLKFCKRYFNEECADTEADVIICRHVIEHISDPVALLECVRKVAGDRKVVLFLETPCVNWILERNVFWDFFYEHCSYFNENSIQTALENAGFTTQNIKHIFGGQYLWVEADLELNMDRHRSQSSWIQFKGLIDNFVAREEQMVTAWRKYLFSINSKRDTVAIWGAGAKGVTFANLLDSDRRLIDCVIDINPNKQGRYLPGTGHLITDIETAIQRGVTHAIIMNPNYKTEIQKMLVEINSNLQLIEECELEVQ